MSRAPADPWKEALACSLRAHGAPLTAIYRHAADTYPEECCGFVRRSGKVHRAINYQNVLHAEDPALWPHSAREAYSLSPSDLYLLGLSFFGDDPAIVVYHSHPDCSAYFSDKDAADALWDGRQIYDVDHLVINVSRGRPLGAKLYQFVRSGFRCVWSDDVDRGRGAHRPREVWRPDGGERSTAILASKGSRKNK